MVKKRGTIISSPVEKLKKTQKKTSNLKNPKRFQYRSNLQGVISKILSLNLTDGHIDSLRAYCPFWKLINLILDHKITLDSVKKSDIKLAKLLNLFNKVTKTFDIGGKSLNLSSQDVISAFGVMGGEQIVFTSQDKCEETSFYKNFEGIKRLTTPIVSKALEAAVKSKGLDASNNVTQLMTLYLLTALFAPTKGATLCWGYNKILSQVEKINSYDWPRHIYDKLNKSIMGNPSHRVAGCVMLIPYWIMENFPVATPRQENADLWCEKWDLQDLTNGVILQVLNTQVTTYNTQHGVVLANGHDEIFGDESGDESGDDGIDDDERGYNEEANEVVVGVISDRVNLSDDGDACDEINVLTQNDVKVENKKVKAISEKNMVNQLKEENLRLFAEREGLKAAIKVRDSEIRALKKHNATLLKRDEDWTNLEKGLRDAIEGKALKISQREKELAGLWSNSSITENENRAPLCKRLSNQGSHVEDDHPVKLEQEEEDVFIGVNESNIFPTKSMIQGKENAVTAALMVKLKNPSFMSILKKQNVHLPYTLNVPDYFGNKYLSSETHFLKLEGPDGKFFEASCFSDGKVQYLSRGWVTFVKEYKLVEGDVCIFELIQVDNVVLKVHIFRAHQTSL